MPWFRRKPEEPPPATRADMARVEQLLGVLSERALRIQQDIAEVNGRLDRSEQGLSTYTYAVRSLSLRLVELDDKLAADGDEKQKAIGDMQGHLRAFELRLPKTREHDPEDPARPATLEELEDVRGDVRQATVQAAAVVGDLRAELARAMVDLQALQARTSPPPPPPPGWRPPTGGMGWTARDTVAAVGRDGAVPMPVDESEGAVVIPTPREAVSPEESETAQPTDVVADVVADEVADEDAEADAAALPEADASPEDIGEHLLHDDTAEIPRREVA